MSSFGEIIEPCSRTTWEDWDDIVDNNGDILKWSTTLEFYDNIDAVYILEGRYLFNCIKAQSQDFIQLINTIPEINLYLYKILSENKYICIVKDYNLLQSSEMVELLEPLTSKSADVIVLLTKPMSQFQSSIQGFQSCIVRKLTNSSKSVGKNYKKLEQPNIISGIAGGVFSLREHQNLPVTALVFYAEDSNLYDIEEINTILQNLNIIKSCTKIVSTVCNSNLYI